MDRFVWDEAKSEENRRLRGIGFEIVHQLDWDQVIFQDDDRFEYDERRIIVVGRIDERPYFVIVVPRDGTLRVLSARRMHEKEAKRYGI